MRPPLSYRFREALFRAGESLANLGAALVAPFERALGMLAHTFLHRTEGLDRADSLLVGILRLLTWPFRMLWALAAAVVRALLPASIRQAVASPFQRLAILPAAIAYGAWRLVEMLNLDRFFLAIAWATQPVWRPIAAFGGFLYAWLATREYRQLVWGIPAMALILPVIAATTWGLVWGHEGVATQYRLAVKKAVDEKDYQSIQFYERKLAQLGVDTKRTDYNTADELANGGKLQEAYERMQKLAPLDQPGYPPAHLWIIQRLITKELNLPAEEAHRLLGAHLDQLKAAGVDPPQLQILRAAWLAEDDKLEEAAKLLAEHVQRFPAAAMQRMSINLTLGNFKEAKHDARAVRTHFQDRLRQAALNGPAAVSNAKPGEEDPSKTSSQEYRWWTVAEGLVGDLKTQTAVVEAWNRDYPNDPLAQKALAEGARRAVDEAMESSRPDADQLATKIAQAAQLGGDAVALHRQIGLLYQQRKHSPVAQSVLNQLKSSGDTPEVVLQILGTYAVVSGESADARDLLKRAVAKDPKDAVAWNNLACALLEIKDADIQEALAAANKALSLAPDSPQFHETRGQVMVRLKQWDKAVDDLELAINGMPSSKSIHRSLADAYAALGQDDLATVHRDQSQ